MLTTLLALVGVYVLHAKRGANIMGWHVNYVIPVGSLIVGVAASSGYGLASYFTGLKIRKGLLWTILLFQLVAYFGAEYVEFASQGPLYRRSTNARVNFVEYFHYRVTHFVWETTSGESPYSSPPDPFARPRQPQPLGNMGYLVVGIEVLGFALGSLIVPAILMKQPYCEVCEMYMKKTKLARMPASVRPRRVSKKDVAATQAYAREQQEAYNAAQAKLGFFEKLIATGDVVALKQNLDSLKPGSKAAGKLPIRILLTLIRCRRCNQGKLRATCFTGQGKQVRSRVLNETELNIATVQGLAAKRSNVTPAIVARG